MLKNISTALGLSSTFSMKDISDFPYDEFEDQRSKYMEAERWFTGAGLDDQDEVASRKSDLYPMRINPIPGMLLKHAYILLGEPEDDGRLQIVTKLIPPELGNDELRNRRRMERICLIRSGGRTMAAQS